MVKTVTISGVSSDFLRGQLCLGEINVVKSSKKNLVFNELRANFTRIIMRVPFIKFFHF